MIEVVGKLDVNKKAEHAELFDLVKGLLQQIELPRQARSPSTIRAIKGFVAYRCSLCLSVVSAQRDSFRIGTVTETVTREMKLCSDSSPTSGDRARGQSGRRGLLGVVCDAKDTDGPPDPGLTWESSGPDAPATRLASAADSGRAGLFTALAGGGQSVLPDAGPPP